MRKINYDEYMKEKKEKYFGLRALLGDRRGAGRKPRNPEEQDALIRLDYLRYQKWIENGDLIVVSPKKYIVKI